MAQAIPNPTDCCTTCDCTDTQTTQSLTGAIVANFSFANYAAARAYASFVTDMVVGVLGETTRSDGGEGMFYYNSTSSAADDGSYVLRPNNIAIASMGRLIRMTVKSTVGIGSPEGVVVGRQGDLYTESDTGAKWTFIGTNGASTGWV